MLINKSFFLFFTIQSYSFDYSLVLPSNWPPYDRTKWGKVDTKLVAIVKSPGWLEQDLKTEHTIGFVFNHAPAGESHSIDTIAEGYDEVLGVCVFFKLFSKEIKLISLSHIRNI